MKHDINNKKQLITRTDIMSTYGIKEHLYQSMVNSQAFATIRIGKLNYHPIDEVDKVIAELEERKKMRVTYYTGSRRQ
jgi:hypothetical protein